MAIIKQIIVYSLIFPNFLTSGHLTVILYTPMIVQNNRAKKQIVKLYFRFLKSYFTALILHPSKPLSHHVTCGDWSRCSGECLTHDGCQPTCL